MSRDRSKSEGLEEVDILAEIDKEMNMVIQDYVNEQYRIAEKAKDKGRARAVPFLVTQIGMAGTIGDGMIKIESLPIDQLRQGELGDRIRAAARELAERFLISEIRTVRGLVEYAKNARKPEKSPEEKMEAIKDKLQDILATYEQNRSLKKTYSGTLFGYSKDQKLTAVNHLQELLKGEGYVYKDDVSALRDGELGKELREAARELAKELKTPEIGTVRGLISFVQNGLRMQNPFSDDPYADLSSSEEESKPKKK